MQSAALPASLTRFVGRERELRELRGLLGRTRLLTLTGAGGVGKTRLAVELAAAEHVYQDSLRLVQLGSTADPEMVPHVVGHALGLRVLAHADGLDQVLLVLRDQRLLLILDNCEHLRAACAAFVEPLLLACPRVAVLVTSREPLGLAGETTWRVPSLTFPWRAEPLEAGQLSEFEAVRLFLDRAEEADPHFVLTEANSAAVAEICYRLDGIPLALELAAARLRVLDVDQVAGRLGDRFRLLTGGQRGGLTRNQTLLASVEWSHELLAESERTLFRRLAVFAGSWSIQTAEQVCAFGELGEQDVLMLLAQLVDKSLVQREQRESGGRYRLLETLRAFASARLHDSGEFELTGCRHAQAFVDLAEEAEPALRGADQARWLTRLGREHDNFRAALDTLVGRGDGETALRLAVALWWFWLVRGHLVVGRRRLSDVLGMGYSADPRRRALALYGLGRLAVLCGASGEAWGHYVEGLELSRQLGDIGLTARMLQGQSRILELRGDIDGALSLGQQSLTHAHDAGDVTLVVDALNAIGNAEWRRHAHDAAEGAYERALTLTRQLGDGARTAALLGNLGAVALNREAFARAEPLLQESVAMARGVGDQVAWAKGLCNLGASAYRQGRRVTVNRADTATVLAAFTDDVIIISGPCGDQPNDVCVGKAQLEKALETNDRARIALVGTPEVVGEGNIVRFRLQEEFPMPPQAVAAGVRRNQDVGTAVIAGGKIARLAFVTDVTDRQSVDLMRAFAAAGPPPGSLPMDMFARDGQTLVTQPTATQVQFLTTWGDQAGARWAKEHDALLARNGN